MGKSVNVYVLLNVRIFEVQTEAREKSMNLFVLSRVMEFEAENSGHGSISEFVCTVEINGMLVLKKSKCGKV